MNDIASQKPEDLAKGEKRLEPVDVDTIDNLINAQAAYLEAMATAYEHFGITAPSDHIVDPLMAAMSKVAGTVLLAVSAARL